MPLNSHAFNGLGRAGWGISRLTLLTVAGLSAACGAQPAGSSGPPGGGPGGPPAVPVEIATVETRPVELYDEYIGVIRSRRSTTIQPQVEGFLTDILVASGARVDPGTPLFEIEASTQRAVVASLEGQLASRQADAAYARQEVDRARMLRAEGLISQQEYDQALALRKTADAQVASVEEQLREQQAELAYYQVVAPTSGVVGDVPVRVGDRVTQSTVLTSLEDNDGLELYVNVPVRDARDLETGLAVRILDEDGATVVTSRIAFVAPAVDDSTQTVLAKAPVARTDVLRADQFVRAQLVWRTDPTLTVPVVAAQRLNGRYFVYVAEDADGGLVARLRPVTLGSISGDAYVVVDGITAGDRLIMAGTQKIGDGAPVQPLPTGPPDDAGPAGPPPGV